jgi:Z1 domain
VTSGVDAVTRKRQMERLEQFVTVVMQDGHLGEPELLEKLQQFNQLVPPPLDAGDLELVARRLSERLNIDVDRGAVITSADYQPWLADIRREIEWDRWLAYKQLLIKQGRPLRVIDKLDELTDVILDLAGNPALEGLWARRGLVLGDVQSGKTGTYLGLFNKAADVGYRLIILLAGNTEALRQQTQARVDEAFIGRDSSRQFARKGTDITPSKLIGVGTIRKDLAQSVGMTTTLRDFRRSSYEATNITIQTNAAHPYVFVVKKNKSILNALIAWLKEQAASSGGGLSVPVLLLDDESDYASINTKEDTDPTAINQAIRNVLALFSRSSYIAFTATPFANIFVDHGIENDLFPRNFVYSLEAPSNYVGSVATFGTSDEVRTDGLHELDDVDDLIPIGHRSQLLVSELPESLLNAVRTFLLSNAIRDLRDDADQRRSMLVNVSRYKNVQRQVFDLLSDQVSRIRAAVELHHAEHATGHSEIAALRRQFEAEYSQSGEAWRDVVAILPSSTSDVRVLLFNSDKDIRLDQDDLSWDRPTRMIAVGGDVLSRGLTLDGLCVSYFYRRVAASDTLMQMARWFGYRDGYKDLCRLWINTESADNYRFSADAIEDLRTDLRLMLRQQRTPEDFGLAVRKHPGALLITARNKMKNAQIARKVIGLAGRRLETTSLVTDQRGSTVDVESRNRHALLSLVAVAEETAEYLATRAGWHRWLALDKAHIADFLDGYVAPLSDPFFSGSTLSVWTRRNRVPSFATWDLVIAKGQVQASIAHIGSRHFPLSKRNLTPEEDLVRVSGKSRRLAGPTDLKGLVDKELGDIAEAEFKEANPGRATQERIYYPHLERPALVVYALERTAKRDDYLVALKVAIPGDPTDVKNSDGEVEYLINTVAQEQWLTEFQGADDDDVDA